MEGCNQLEFEMKNKMDFCLDAIWTILLFWVFCIFGLNNLLVLVKQNFFSSMNIKQKVLGNFPLGSFTV